MSNPKITLSQLITVTSDLINENHEHINIQDYLDDTFLFEDDKGNLLFELPPSTECEITSDGMCVLINNKEYELVVYKNVKIDLNQDFKSNEKLKFCILEN